MTLRQVRGLVSATTLFALAFMSQACATMFADARMVGKGRAEVTPHFSALGFASGRESGHLSNNFGIQVIGGVHERVDFGAGYLRAQNPEGEGGINFAGFGPKFGLSRPDTRGAHVALATPLSFMFGEDVETSDSFVFSPALLTTFPVSDRVDLNPSARVIIPLSEPSETLLGFTFGVGVGPADKRFIVRPEFGIIVNPGESGVIWTVGAGMSFRTR